MHSETPKSTSIKDIYIYIRRIYLLEFDSSHYTQYEMNGNDS